MTVKGSKRRGSNFVEVRRNGRLLFRYDPKRNLVEIKPKGKTKKELINLSQYKN